MQSKWEVTPETFDRSPVRVRENYGMDNHTRIQNLSTDTHLIIHCRIFPVSDQNNPFLRPAQSFSD
jgi:hypothetical protein